MTGRAEVGGGERRQSEAITQVAKSSRCSLMNGTDALTVLFVVHFIRSEDTP